MAAEAILVNGATEILKRLSIFVAEEIGLAWGVKDELQKLKKTVDMILAVLVDAEKKQVRSEAVRLWLKELKDIAYEADDILDEYSYEVMHQREMNRKREKVRNFFSSSNPLAIRSKIAHEIKDINKKFDEIAKLKESLGLQIIEVVGASRTTNLDQSRKIRETDSIVDESLRIVGRDNDKSNIINKLLAKNLCNQDGNIQVIPIVGMGGLGKTTLAQLIYNDDALKNHFELKMWVYVSDDFDVKKIYMKIIESITDNKFDHMSNIDVITRQLQEHLSGKKYLLVLDDVWNKKREEWVRLRKPLVVGGKGSKIIVTTRSDKVASIMADEFQSYKLGILNENESWSLFEERIFRSVGGAKESPRLFAIGKELVKKCGGLPLAINFLGSLMRSKGESEWRVINDDKIWVQSCEEEESIILPVLKLSYDYLPSHLKQCFSYLSLFTKNHKFIRQAVIQVWMAEGFLVQPSGVNKMSIEEVGNEYLKSLFCNSFFLDVKKNELGEVLTFRMHDLVHDLAKYVAGDCQCLVLETCENMENIPNVRRLKLDNFNEGMLKTVCKALHNKPTLRTLIIDGTVKKIDNAFDGTKRLRVLDLFGVTNIEELPSSLIGNLKHLRYLCLCFTNIRVLPESIMRLYHLQTLRLSGCLYLKELPKSIKHLINLRHLFLPDHIYVPKEIGRLSSLQTLYPYNVGNKDEGCGIEVLEGLKFLKGIMTFNHLRNVKSGKDAQLANLKGKKDLNGVFLSWHVYADGAREEEDYECVQTDVVVLEALQPHPDLEWLCIDQFFGAKLPWWMSASPSCLPNLVTLQLSHFLKCELVGFGKLPSLRFLTLFWMDGIKCLGNEFYSGGSRGDESSSSTGTTTLAVFPSLKELTLSDMRSLEEWMLPPPTVASFFPNLEKICIYFCPNLKITPTRFPSLKELHVQEISERVAVPIITTNLNSLDIIEMIRISKLRFLPHFLLQHNNLRELRVVDCPDFEGFLPDEGLHQSKVSVLGLWLIVLPALKFLPDIRSITSLEYLYINDCKSFKPLPEDLTCLSSSLENLRLVEILNLKETKDFEWQK